METSHCYSPFESPFLVAVTVTQWEIDDQNYDSIKEIKFPPQTEVCF